MEHLIKINWDEEARVWYAVCDSIPLALESNSFDALIERAKVTALEVLELNDKNGISAQLCFEGRRREHIA
ncbi:MAG: DUF1902 domain-containing protein [Syntrophomonadaceae bacterium]|nr:DUF1902 domain-containing protein [Syntrophomonadaceae bacterium]